MEPEDEAFEELSRRQGYWGLQGSRKHQILRYAENVESKEQNFCSRCGKRTADKTVIHTCTPPKENT